MLIHVFEEQILIALNILLNKLLIISLELYIKMKTYENDLSARIIKEFHF